MLGSACAGGESKKDQEAGQGINSCAIVTTRANEAVQELHDRMPVIISQEHFDLWLDRSLQDPESLQPLLEPVSSGGWSSIRWGRR